MIEMRFDETGPDGGTWLHMLVCDYCRLPIDARQQYRGAGMAVWSGKGPACPADLRGKRIPKGGVKFGRPVMHVHLGKCEETARRELGAHFLWEPISDHLAFLTHNAGINQETPCP
jgi:hypothetical protein